MPEATRQDRIDTNLLRKIAAWSLVWHSPETTHSLGSWITIFGTELHGHEFISSFHQWTRRGLLSSFSLVSLSRGESAVQKIPLAAAIWQIPLQVVSARWIEKGFKNSGLLTLGSWPVLLTPIDNGLNQSPHWIGEQEANGHLMSLSKMQGKPKSDYLTWSVGGIASRRS